MVGGGEDERKALGLDICGEGSLCGRAAGSALGTRNGESALLPFASRIIDAKRHDVLASVATQSALCSSVFFFNAFISIAYGLSDLSAYG